MTAPGVVTGLSVTVLLDRRGATATNARLVRSMIVGYTSIFPDSPAPMVTLTKLTSADEADVALDPLDGGAMAGPGAGTDAIGTDAMTQEEMAAAEAAAAGTSRVLLAIGAVVVIGLLTAIIILWRRSVRMAEERRRYEEEFRNEQRLLDDFAKANPEDIARDLEALLGAPAPQDGRSREGATA